MSKKEIKQEKSSDQQNFFEIEIYINKWGDIHFKKAMLEELAKVSKIYQAESKLRENKQATALIMSFMRDRIEIRKKS